MAETSRTTTRGLSSCKELISEPAGDVVNHRADGASRQARPEQAQQQHRVRALQGMDVDQMGHDWKSNASALGSKGAGAKQGCSPCVALPRVYAAFTCKLRFQFRAGVLNNISF